MKIEKKILFILSLLLLVGLTSKYISNIYCFVAHNRPDINVKYYENTNYDINLKYGLKRNDNYVIGNNDNWIMADELNTTFSHLNMRNSDKYSLDWKWKYESDNDDKDKHIGKNIDDLYKLNIRFNFEQV